MLSEQELTTILQMLQKLCQHVGVNVDSSKQEVQSFSESRYVRIKFGRVRSLAGPNRDFPIARDPGTIRFLISANDELARNVPLCTSCWL